MINKDKIFRASFNY